MANILVSKNYKLKDQSKWPRDRSRETVGELYTEMQKYLLDTAQQYLQNLDDIIVHQGEADNIRDVFKIHFMEIYELWKQGHNILYCDLDVIFNNPTDVFGKFNQFTMFNYTDPKSTIDHHYNVSLSNFFNCGVRYYPENMSQEIWDLGLKMLDNWNPDRWDAEQIIYNVMMWRQSPRLDEFLHPELNWMSHHYRIYGDQQQKQYAEKWNELPLEEAQIIHFAGTRGAAQVVDLMKNFTGQTHGNLL